MSHAIHDLPRRVFGDDCDECIHRAESGLEGLTALDSTNLRKLAEVAEEMITGPAPEDASDMDLMAVAHLRLAARIVFASGITEEAAR